MAKAEFGWFPIVIIAILLYVAVPAINTNVNSLLGIAPSTPAPTPGVPGAPTYCPDPTTTMTVGPMLQQFSPTTSMAAVGARVYVNNVDRGIVANGATLTVSHNDKVDVFYGANASGHYTSKVSFTVPCRTAISTAEFNAGAHELYAYDTSTNLNFRFFNDKTGVLNSAAAQESLSQGETVNVAGSIQGGYEQAFSPFGGIYVTMKYNSTAYEEVVFTPQTSGFTATAASTPTFRSNAASQTGYALRTVKLNKGLISNEKLDFILTVKTHSVNAPVNATGDILIYFDDENWYRNTRTNTMEFGAETNLNADVGVGQNLATYYVE